MSVVAGGLVLVGWGFPTERVKAISPGAPAIDPTTALAFILLGGSLWLSATPPAGWRRRLAHACGAVLSVCAILQLCDYFFDWHTGVDRLLFNAAGVTVTGGADRMAPSTVVNFLVFGCVLLLFDVQRRWRDPVPLLLIVSVLASLLPIFRHLYDLSSFYDGGAFRPMALPTALTFLIVVAGFVYARPHRGLPLLLGDRGVAGVTARRLFPAATLLPAFLGWLALRGLELQFYNINMGVALFAVTITLVFTLLVWRNARLLWHIEATLIKTHDRAIESAQRDSLTNLPNRLLLHDRLTHSIAEAQREQGRLAVLLLDLDRFQHVNDSLGHPIGDRLLQSVAVRLLAVVGGSDTVSRQDGDEFAVLLPGISRPLDAAGPAQRIIDALLLPHEIAAHQLHVTAKIGISIYPDDGVDAETLLKCADTAMADAKKSGKPYQFFERGMNTRAVERQWIEAGLRRALSEREFVLHYQPTIDLETGAMTGAEALIRWQHPVRGLLPPAAFVPIAEECGLIAPIDEWALGEACRQARAWIDEGRAPMAVAVNVSATEFRNPFFVEGVRTALRDSGLEARHLELELTERSLMQNVESTLDTLRALRTMGVLVAIDDFGTGYSSLSYLGQFSADVLKIDQSFLRDLHRGSAGASIVRAVISMARGLGCRVVAEGIETREHLAFLRAEGCGEGQGYYFSQPVAPEPFGGLRETDLSALVRVGASRSRSVRAPSSTLVNVSRMVTRAWLRMSPARRSW